MLSSLPLARSGKIKALGLTSLKRAAAAPEIPTVEESGMKGFEFVSWYGLWAPQQSAAGRQRVPAGGLSEGAGAAGGEADGSNELGFDPIGSTSEHFAKYIDIEMAKYAADHPRREDRRAAAIV